VTDISYSELTRDEIKQLSDTLIKSKLIEKYNRDQLMETKFDKSTMNKLINRPMKILIDDESDKAYVVIIGENGHIRAKY